MTNPTGKVLRIMGVDTALRVTGLGVIDYDGGRFKAVQFGVIRNSSSLTPLECIGRIYKGISSVITGENPDVVVVEGVFFCKNVKTAVTLGEARGAVFAAVAEAGLPISEYSPRKIKQAVVGYGAADKEQVRKMVVSILGLDTTPAYDASDALAAAICHANNIRISSLLNSR